MKRVLKKLIAMCLVISTIVTSISMPVFASASDSTQIQRVTVNKSAVKKATIQYDSKSVTINGVKYSQKQFEQLLNKAVEQKQSNDMGVIRPAMAEVLAGAYFIPGVGEVLITATGVIIIGGAVIAAGCWIGKKVSAYFSKQRTIKIIKSKIPSRLLDQSGKVNLGKFKQKVKGKTAYKETGGWVIDKDNAGHGGRKWKLKNKAGKRIGSLDGNGKILGE